jgi:predicted MFS family arabinose efflux permease
LKRANPIGALLHLKKYPNLIGLVLAIFILYVGSHAVQSNWNYFTMYQFNWDEKMVGISLGIIGLLVGIVQGGLIRWINPKIGNVKSIYFGLALYTIGMFLFAFATESWMMFAFLNSLLFGRNCRSSDYKPSFLSQVPAIRTRRNSRNINEFNECFFNCRSTDDGICFLLFYSQ